MATITTRTGKGTPLTNTEVDDNFTNLNTDKIENVVEDTTPQLGGNLDLNSNDITGTGNINVTGSVTSSGEISANGGIALGDNDKATFGTGDDLQIYHDGTNSRIDDAGSGRLILRGNGGVSLEKYTGETLAMFNADGASSLYYDNSAKLATTNTGIDVTGTVTADGLTVEAADANTTLTGSTSASIVLQDTGASTNQQVTQLLNNDGDFVIRSLNDAKTGVVATAMTIENLTGNVGIGCSPSDRLEVKGASSAGVIVISSGDTTITGNDVIGQLNFKDYDADAHVGGDQDDVVNIKAIALHETGGATAFDGSANEGYALSFSTSKRPSANAAFTVSEAMRIDEDGNVGIGTQSPAGGATKVVDVYGSTSSAVNFHNATSGTTATDGGVVGQYGNDLVLFNYETGILQFGTSNTEAMRLDANGNLGIGVTPSAWGSANYVNQVYGASISSNGYAHSRLAMNLYKDSGGNTKSLDANYAVEYEQVYDGSHRFYSSTAAAGSAGATVTMQERMRIDSSGNVGIGTDSPVSDANYTGLTLSGSTGSQIVFQDDGTTEGLIWNSNALNIEASSTNPTVFRNNGSESMRIDSSGNLLVGKTTTAFGTAGVRAISNGQLQATANNNEPLDLNRTGNDGEIINFYKDSAQVGSIGTATNALYLVTDRTELHFGVDGTGQAYTDIPGGVAFSVFTAYDNSADLGRLTARFDDIYATNGTIQTSDRNEKQDIEELSEAEQRVAVAAKALLRKFRWKDSVEEKGDDARIHFGIIAQDLQAAFEAEGLDAGRYAMFIYSTWTDEETGEERSRMGVRYSELLAFIIAAI